jgi:predicted phosphodiesterase
MSKRTRAEDEEIERLICEYLELHPTIPSRTLARVLCEKYELLFPNLENARTLIRARRGAHGESSLKYRTRAGKKIFDSPGVLNPFVYPEAELHELEPYQIPVGNTRIGIISDIHFPKQCNQTIDLALTDFAENNVDTIILNGDLMDNPTFSKFPVDPNYRSKVQHWFDKTEYFLESLRGSFPNALILFVEGNHDAWYKKWLWMKAKNLAADPYYSLEERLHLMDYNIKFIPEIQLIRLADYFVFHGHQHAKGGQLDTVAKRMLAKLNSNCIIGHMHYASMFTGTDIMGEPYGTVHVLGAASTLKPSYMPFGGKSRKGYMNIKVVDRKCQIENVWNNNGKKVIINA